MFGRALGFVIKRSLQFCVSFVNFFSDHSIFLSSCQKFAHHLLLTPAYVSHIETIYDVKIHFTSQYTVANNIRPSATAFSNNIVSVNTL